MRAHFQREPESEWTTYNASLERPLLNSRKFLEPIKAANGAAPDDAEPGVETPQSSANAAASGDAK
jgi:hypothetical protein